jgi:hypothetical protein
MFALLVGVWAIACATGEGDLGVGDGIDDPRDARDGSLGDAGGKPGNVTDAASLADGSIAVDASPEKGSDASAPVAPEDDDAAVTPQADAAPDAKADTGAPIVDAGTDAKVDSGVDAGPGVDAGCPLRLVVNELQSEGASASDEFLEIYNPTACTITLTGWTIRHTSINGTTIQTEWTGAANKTIASHGYAIVAGSGFAGPGATVGVFNGTGVMAAAGGGMGLYDPTGKRVDSVGYGAGATNPLVESAAMAGPLAGQSIGRRSDGLDTDRNLDDFKTFTTPTPGAAN